MEQRSSLYKSSIRKEKKGDRITPDEIAELDASRELERIFNHINGMLAAQNTNQ